MRDIEQIAREVRDRGVSFYSGKKKSLGDYDNFVTDLLRFKDEIGNPETDRQKQVISVINQAIDNINVITLSLRITN